MNGGDYTIKLTTAQLESVTEIIGDKSDTLVIVGTDDVDDIDLSDSSFYNVSLSVDAKA